MWNAMTNCGLAMLEAAMRHDPASGAIVIMLRSLKMHGMAQAVIDLIEQRAPAFEAVTLQACLQHDADPDAAPEG